MTTTVDQYKALITSEHFDKPKFTETVGVSVSPLAKIQEVLSLLPVEFDIDTATGVQLDVDGIWVGRSRRIDTPLTGIYFAWDSTLTDGWEAGVWQGEFDPTSGLVDLPDDAYRVLLKAKIAANNWDGTIPGAYAVWEEAFGAESVLVIQDNQDMSMVVGIAGSPLSSVEQALLLNGYIPLKPEGVKINYYAIAPADGTLFAWDTTEFPAFGGWDSGNWAIEVVPI